VISYTFIDGDDAIVSLSMIIIINSGVHPSGFILNGDIIVSRASLKAGVEIFAWTSEMAPHCLGVKEIWIRSRNLIT
jgi:hypothetical protein